MEKEDKFITLLPFINGIKVKYLKNKTVDRCLDTPDFYPFNCDVLKPETIRAAVETLQNKQLNDLLFECHLKKQDDAIKMTDLIHRKIMSMLGYPDPFPQEKTAAEEQVVVLQVQESYHVN